jgi:4-hydroxy-tetrahydrodipicolinate reductase
VKVILFGLGAMGTHIARVALKKKGLKIVGALEISKTKVGQDLGKVLGLEQHLGIQVTDDLEILHNVNADVVIHATGSYLPQVYQQITQCVKAGLNVVSTCEELSYPYYKFPKLALELDKMAKAHGVTVLGTGINPGYLMDTLPITLTGPCIEVKSVKVTRMMFSGNRRNSYQKKIGTGLTASAFNEMINEGTMTGHVGLVESICMIAKALGWTLDEIVELPPEPIITKTETTTTYTTIPPHHVVGLKSVAYGTKNGKRVIILEFVSHANVEQPYDAVTIEGTPTIHERIEGGVHGDLGTIAMVINSIPNVIKARPGLVTMRELPLPSAVVEDLRTYLD